MTTISNLVADTLIMADKSELNRTIEAYREQHPDWSEEKLRKEALKDLAIQTGWDVVGGTVSGGIMGGGYSAINKGIDKLHSLAQEKVDAEQQALQQLANEMNGVGKQHISMVDFANRESPVWRNVDYADNDTKISIMQDAHNAMVAEGAVVKVSDEIASTVDQAYPDLRAMKKKDRTPILKSAMSKLKNELRQFLNGFKNQTFEFDVNGKVLDATLYNTGINEVLEKVSKEKANMLYSTEDIFRNARYLYSTQDYDGDPNVYRWNYFYTPVQIGEETVGVRIAVRDMVRGTDVTSPESQIYNWGIKKNAPLDGGSRGPKVASSSVSSDASINNISQSVPGVNGDILSTDGKILRGNASVQIADVDAAGNGKLTVKLTDGSTADITELSFSNEGEQEMWRVLAEYSENAEVARQFLKEYRAGELNALQYARGVEEGFMYGKLNIGEGEMARRGSYVNLLNPVQRNTAYRHGQYAGEKQARQRQQRVDTGKKSKTNKSGQLHFTGDRDSLTHRQKVSLQACEVVAKALGIQVYVFESELNAQGKRVGDNGWYDPSDGSIHIDLHAGENGEGVMVFTLAHELTHFIKDWSPAKFRTLSTFLAQQYGKKGLSVRDMILRQQAKAKQNGRELTFEQAHEEWVADSMEMMLTDGTILEKLSMLQAKDKGLAQKIRQFLDNFLKRLKAAYKGVSPQTVEGHIVEKMVDAAQQLQNLFAEALTDAGENYRSAEKNTTGEGGVRHMSREESASIKEQLVAASEKLNEMDVVVSVVSDGFAGLRDSDVAKQLEKEFSKFGNKIDRKDFGVILLSYQQINKALNYLKMPSEKAAMLTVPRVLKRGIQIDAHTKHKERGVDSYTFAAPVEINGKRGNVGVVVQRVTGTNRFKTLRILLPNGKAFEFTKNIEADSTAGSSSKHQSPEGIPIESASLNSISKKTEDVKKNDSTERKHSSRSDNAVSDRAMLVDMFEQMVTDSNEYKVLQNYKKHMNEMLALEEKVERLTSEIGRLSFAEGPRDTEYLNKLKLQKKQAINRLNYYDSKLLGLEKSGVLKAMIERNRQKVTQESFDRAREYYRERNQRRENEIREYYRESRRKAVERHDMAEVRQQIRKDVQRLDSLLNKGTKNKNVKLGLQEFVGSALRLAKGTFLTDYNEYDMIRSGLQNKLLPEEQAAFNRCRELLQELDNLPEEPGPDSIHDKWDPEQVIHREDREAALKRELAQNMRILRDGNVFQRERAGTEQATAEELADELLRAYQKLAESEFEHLQGLYSLKVYDQIEKVKEFLSGKAIKDMTTIELQELRKLYRMVSEAVSRADELFGAHRNEKTSKRGNRMLDQLKTDRDADMTIAANKLKEFGWSLLTPEAAAAVIGSEELSQAIREIEATETVQAENLEHAKNYAAEQAIKYHRNQWDTSRQFKFAGTEITLGQAMSLYAYTERKAGRDHISGDGFVHSKEVPIKQKWGKLKLNLKFIKDTTRAYQVTEDMYTELGKLLTEEQKDYARAMRDYLAEVMGAKGNEVSRELYGIEMYGEKFYFPLKSAKNFLDSALGAKRGEVKVTNQGFTHQLQEGASNAIVLEDFESVWAKHVQEMSNYHACGVAMENFNRLYNYRKTEQRETTDKWGQPITEEVKSSEPVSLHIERRVAGANGYLVKWMESVNGGVRSDATEKLLGGLLGNFRKTAVLGNLSVIVQQPTAILRAVPYLGKDFLAGWQTWKTTKTPEKGLVREMYRHCPVAVLKKMGGFDPSAGQTVRQYLFDGRDDGKGKLRKGLDKTNEVLGLAPEKMDELAWSYLWLSCKKKTLRENKGFRAGSKEHCQAAAELFTQIVRETQVYDSVMSKPLIMQSKNMAVKGLTSFMNEPLKGLNQCITAVARWKNGEISKSGAAKHILCVGASNLLASAVSCLIYALRDDDEEETYGEKYLKHFSGRLLDLLNPLSSVPGIKEIFSIIQGYGSERSEFAIISDAWSGLQKLFKESKAETPEELEKEVWDKLEKGLGNILNLSGIPARNLIREIRGIYYTFKRAGAVEATDAGTRYALREGFTGKEVSKADQLYNAVVEDDGTHLMRVMSTWDEPKTAVSNLVSAVKNAYLDGKITDDRATEYLQEFGGKTLEDVSDYLAEWEFKKTYPDSELKDSKAIDYIEIAAPAGISLETYTLYIEQTEGLTSEKDKDGDPIPGSKQKKVVNVIHALPLTGKQKDALYLAEGYTESGLKDTPWH